MPREYRSSSIIVTFEPRFCIHAARCLTNLPDVFDVDMKPWIQPQNAPADRVAEVVMTCPTGALHFRRLDDGQEEKPDPQTTVEIRPAGPLFLRGNVQIKDASGNVIRQDTRVALCRCGYSANKPFCDGSHRAVRFEEQSKLTDRSKITQRE